MSFGAHRYRTILHVLLQLKTNYSKYVISKFGQIEALTFMDTIPNQCCVQAKARLGLVLARAFEQKSLTCHAFQKAQLGLPYLAIKLSSAQLAL